jgi:hypothetical protein
VVQGEHFVQPEFLRVAELGLAGVCHPEQNAALMAMYYDYCPLPSIS